MDPFVTLFSFVICTFFTSLAGSQFSVLSWSSQAVRSAVLHLRPSCLQSVAAPLALALAERRPHSERIQTTSENCVVLRCFWFGCCACLCDLFTRRGEMSVYYYYYYYYVISRKNFAMGSPRTQQYISDSSIGCRISGKCEQTKQFLGASCWQEFYKWCCRLVLVSVWLCVAEATRYIVQVETGDADDFDPITDVYIILYGEHGDSGRRYLSKSKEGGQLFELFKVSQLVDDGTLPLASCNTLIRKLPIYHLHLTTEPDVWFLEWAGSLTWHNLEQSPEIRPVKVLLVSVQWHARLAINRSRVRIPAVGGVA